MTNTASLPVEQRIAGEQQALDQLNASGFTNTPEWEAIRQGLQRNLDFHKGIFQTERIIDWWNTYTSWKTQLARGLNWSKWSPEQAQAILLAAQQSLDTVQPLVGSEAAGGDVVRRDLEDTMMYARRALGLPGGYPAPTAPAAPTAPPGPTEAETFVGAPPEAFAPIRYTATRSPAGGWGLTRAGDTPAPTTNADERVMWRGISVPRTMRYAAGGGDANKDDFLAAHGFVDMTTTFHDDGTASVRYTAQDGRTFVKRQDASGAWSEIVPE